MKTMAENNEKPLNKLLKRVGRVFLRRHFSQIVPRDFDLSPNFEIVKYNIIRLGEFDYKSIWAER